MELIFWTNVIQDQDSSLSIHQISSSLPNKTYLLTTDDTGCAFEHSTVDIGIGGVLTGPNKTPKIFQDFFPKSFTTTLRNEKTEK